MKNSFVREILKAKLLEPGGGSTVELAESYLDAPPGDTQLKFRFTRTSPRGYVTWYEDESFESFLSHGVGVREDEIQILCHEVFGKFL